MENCVKQFLNSVLGIHAAKLVWRTQTRRERAVFHRDIQISRKNRDVQTRSLSTTGA